MAGPTPETLERSGTLDELYPQLADIGLGAGWNKPTPSLWAAPHQTFPPDQWRYADAKGAFGAAGRLINTELAERRNLILINPLEGNGYATARTLVAAYQMIMPGETARSHRHTPNALRLVLDAEHGAYTMVNGKRLPMVPNDVVLTPNWCWHGHGNDGKHRAIWLDFLDVPLVHLLDPMFFEPHPQEFEANAPEDAAVAAASSRGATRSAASMPPSPIRAAATARDRAGPARARHHGALHDAARARARHDALPHHRQHALCRGRGRGHEHRRGQALRLGARRRHRRADLAPA